MPVENMEEEGLQKIPDLGISQLKFQIQHLDYKDEEKKINFPIGNLLSMVGLFTLHFRIQ